jgi:UDP-3-O-[3-hydroxymyristoyl] glucosamine N-acyltransferase
MGGQVGIAGHLHIANGVKINAQSGVNRSVKTDNISITGSPAFEYRQAMRSQILSRNLPELVKRIEELEEKIQDLTSEKEL